MSSVLFCDPHSLFYFLEVVFCSFLFFFTRSELDLFTLTCLCLFSLSLSCLQATEANSISLRSVSGGAEVSRSSQPPRPLLPPPRPGAPALLPALRPARLPGVCGHAAPRPPLLPHARRYRSSRRPHPRAGRGAPGTSPGASEGLTAEGAKESDQVSANAARDILQFHITSQLPNHLFLKSFEGNTSFSRSVVT